MKGVINLKNSGSNGKLNVREMIEEKKNTVNFNSVMEKFIPKFLFAIAAISIFTTIGIVLTLLTETINFFRDVPFLDFFTGTELNPIGREPQFGVLPLLTGTIISTIIAMLVAIPVGVMAAVYLSEYASEKIRKNT